jgi:hypothetical protein
MYLRTFPDRLSYKSLGIHIQGTRLVRGAIVSRFARGERR